MAASTRVQLLVCAALLCAGCKPTEASVKAKKTDFSMSAEDLGGQCEAKKLTISTAWEGKVVEYSGRLGDVSPGTKDSPASALIGAPGWLLHCDLLDDQLPKAESLSKGETVKLKGTFEACRRSQSVGGWAMDLKNCVFLDSSR